MKVLHIILSCFYVEGLGYQENILPKYHRIMGNDVVILTSTFPNSYLGDKRFMSSNDYVNDDGIHVIKVVRKKIIGFGERRLFNDYYNVYEKLEVIKPDIIFIHGLTSLADYDIARYLKKNRNVKAFADQHGDFYNAPINKLKYQIANAFVWKPAIHRMDRYIEKYWGTTPWRCKYLHDVFGISKAKIGLLVMGGDDQYIHLDKAAEIRDDIRKKLGFSKESFVIATGGKIDSTKNIDILMQAIKEIDDDKLKLLVFGKPNAEMQPIIGKLSKEKNIVNIGWVDANKVYDYFIASDLVAFPGTHSVLWEQACACGVPGLYKFWEGMTHVNVNGSAIFLRTVTTDTLKGAIQKIYTDHVKYDEMKKAAMIYGTRVFSYKQIAKIAIGTENLNQM